MFVMPGDRAGRRRVRPGTSLRQLGNSSGGGLDLTTTGVTPGSYTLAGFTVGADGRLTAASSGATGNNVESSWTTPTVAGLTRVNTTGFTTTDDTNGVFIWRSGALSATDNLALAHVAVPGGGGTWNAIVRLGDYLGDEAFGMVGIHLYDGTKVICYGLQSTNTASPGKRMIVNYFTNTTTFSSSPKTFPCTNRFYWWKINYDLTSYNFYFSNDGYSWMNFATAPKNALFAGAATHAGFFLDAYASSIAGGVKCLSLTCS